MFNPRTLLAARFALIIAALCYSVLERATNRLLGDETLEPLSPGLLGAMWDRAVGLGRRFAGLATRLRAGTLRVSFRRRIRRATSPAVAVPTSRQAQERVALPRGFGWFLRLSPHAHNAVSQLRLLLREPEMAALVAEHPGFGRVVRPLCHMLAIRPQPDLPALRPLPARVRPPRVRTPRVRTPRPASTPEQERRAEQFSRKTAFGSPRRERRSKNA